MKIKLYWISIDSDILPHTDKDSNSDLNEVVNCILDEFESRDYFEELEIDPKLITILGIFSGRIVEGIADNLIDYYDGRWSGKLFSGDISATLGESLTYAILYTKFDIDISRIIPLRIVKYLGVSPDTIISSDNNKKLVEFLGITKSAILLVNSRSSINYNRYITAENIKKDILNLENLRYPDNYSLLSYVMNYNGLSSLMLVIKP
ncbi:hypothetical protein [Acidianus brierleyi]|uniref:Uncharacterized protein n=1 Tax=Acidianus brierleyi TaxID=41673 RepID=A0A2U9IBM9_9CREN|nr:hypothetical protein [Acidianus brierleyi]AWR93427.1 hypothetical protein DFR85_01200 [Acidianus brierleyi]